MSRLYDLRAYLQKSGVDGFIMPRADAYLGEYVPASAERLKWLTRFTGSAGYAVVLQDKAVVLSDGRYTIQLRQQVDGALFQYGDYTKTPVPEWIKQNTQAGLRIGFDPWVHTAKQIREWTSVLAGHAELVPLPENPVDAVWADRPAEPCAPVTLFPEKYAGLSSVDKRAQLGAKIADTGADACLLGLSDSIAWLLNIRGGDVPCVPVALSYGCLYADGTFDWVIDPRKVGADIQQALGSQVRVRPLEDVLTHLSGKRVMIDPARASAAFILLLEKVNAKIVEGKDPTILPKACKNASELSAMREAHQKDAKAVTAFLNWFDAQDLSTLDELMVERKLEEFRALDAEYRGPSFETIAGAGPNGAIIHYRATPTTNRKLESGSLLLLDSGAQYACGTTDITRTLALGPPMPEMRRHYTMVLKAHIALATAIFPKGTTGTQLDAIVRAQLWSADMDFAHGTGHGVGCYLSVHEEAASISPRGTEPLAPGMVLSNEPGFYVEGAYGIRLENLITVIDLDRTLPDGRPLYGFETLTRVRFDMRLIEGTLLTAAEQSWLAAYHETCPK